MNNVSIACLLMVGQLAAMDSATKSSTPEHNAAYPRPKLEIVVPSEVNRAFQTAHPHSPASTKAFVAFITEFAFCTGVSFGRIGDSFGGADGKSHAAQFEALMDYLKYGRCATPLAPGCCSPVREGSLRAQHPSRHEGDNGR